MSVKTEHCHPGWGCEMQLCKWNLSMWCSANKAHSDACASERFISEVQSYAGARVIELWSFPAFSFGGAISCTFAIVYASRKDVAIVCQMQRYWGRYCAWKASLGICTSVFFCWLFNLYSLNGYFLFLTLSKWACYFVQPLRMTKPCVKKKKKKEAETRESLS